MAGGRWACAVRRVGSAPGCEACACVAREAARRGAQVLEINSNAEGEACVRLLTPAAPAGSVWAPEAAAAQQLRPCGIC